MRKETRYICELCGAGYEIEEKAIECEAFHKIGKICNFEYVRGSWCQYRVTLRFDDGKKLRYILDGEGI